MSNSATVTFTTDRQSGDLSDIMISTNPQSSVINMANWLMAVASGSDAATINVKINNGNAVRASSTLTLASTAANDTAVINGVTLTAVEKREKSTITTGADVAGSLNNKYIVFYTMGSDLTTQTKWYVWYNINSAGVDPAVSSATGIEVAAATGATANAIGTATRAALTTALGSRAIVSGATDQVVIQNAYPGNVTNIADTGSTGFTVATTTAGATVGSTEFQLGASDTVDATSLAALINAQASLTPYVSASSALGVVTVTAVAYGITGNTITLSATGNITAGAARLAGGTADSGSTTYNMQR